MTLLSQQTAERLVETRRQANRWRQQAYRQRMRAELWKARCQKQNRTIRQLRNQLYRAQIRNLLGRPL